MIQRSVTVIACLLAVLGSGTTKSDDTSYLNSGNHLLTTCNAFVKEPPVADSFDVGYCVGFISALVSLQSYYVAVGASPLFCLPDGYNNGQGARVLVKYLVDHPESLHKRDINLAVHAFQVAFPCDDSED